MGRNTRQEVAQMLDRTRRVPMLAIFGLAVALIGAACGSNSSTAPTTGAGSPAASGGAANSVSIVDFAFNPTSINVKTGTTVAWTNTGSAAHTVTADDNSFDSGNLNGGGTFSQTFTTAGTFAYHCKIHSQMKATVVVAP
jgi:plastocyanin